MYLFEKLLLICKKSEDKLYQFKEKIEVYVSSLSQPFPRQIFFCFFLRKSGKNEAAC